MQCLVYACQIEPALPEEEAAGLAKLLLGMADGLQGFVSVSHTQKTMTPCVLQAIQHRLLYASACSAHMRTTAADFAYPHRFCRLCFGVIMQSLCQLYRE